MPTTLSAPSTAGPWTTVGDGVSDAAVQYRPLFNDASAVPGESYYYRVTAHNSAGASPPSNVVGPVTTTHRTLVDECRDLQQLAGHQGDVSLRSDIARRTQEDAHRIALAPGAAIEYRVAAPITAWRVYAFAESPDAEILFAGSADGGRFTPLAAERKSFATGQGDYGYLVPTLYQGAGPEGEPTRLRIERPAGADGSQSLQISRVEIEYGP